ncbi:hypothetical protein PoB_005156400 [Plakobranchus ocellatus]|uniref:Uncharacterized protein n=1 Tax=Plakobranchus ocellatus TaxID=259542 RepID=A0AAV4C1Q6_9GAST|nr:hypothetical protein PoB_005156400 [Plakobranchus ocellatus]
MERAYIASERKIRKRCSRDGQNKTKHPSSAEDRTFQAYLLKRYITRDAAIDETQTGKVFLSTASLAIVEGDDDMASSCDDCGCEVLPMLGGWGSKETAKDLKFGDMLSAEHRRELEDSTSLSSSIFIDRPASIILEVHRIVLKLQHLCDKSCT